MLAAVHPWDINGAKAAGLQAAFVARSGEAYPPFFQQPDLTVASLTDLAKQLSVSHRI
jgi:2-haloacid dehalogenase